MYHHRQKHNFKISRRIHMDAKCKTLKRKKRLLSLWDIQAPHGYPALLSTSLPLPLSLSFSIFIPELASFRIFAGQRNAH